jgi:hypothetical protein
LESLPRRIGASYSLAYTPAFVARLERLGFLPVGELQVASLPFMTRALLQLPVDHVLVLLRHPMYATRVEPAVPLTVEPNVLRWDARRGVRYLVRYAARAQLRAVQGTRQLAISGERADDASDLQFIAVTALEDGPIRIEYHEGWL